MIRPNRTALGVIAFCAAFWTGLPALAVWLASQPDLSVFAFLAICIGGVAATFAGRSLLTRG